MVPCGQPVTVGLEADMVPGLVSVADDSAWGEKVGSHLEFEDERDFAVKKREELSRWRNRKYKTQG